MEKTLLLKNLDFFDLVHVMLGFLEQARHKKEGSLTCGTISLEWWECSIQIKYDNKNNIWDNKNGR